jgi:very-short-patch-repair endonuclease
MNLSSPFLGHDRRVPNRMARNLRRHTTNAERLLWYFLRARRFAGCKFRRQHPIGPFIVDFACVERSLVVEADGGQHAGSAADARRTRWLETEGWRVVRFWNDDIVRRTQDVLEAIRKAVEQS